MIDSYNEKLNWLLITEKHVDVFICLESGKQKKQEFYWINYGYLADFDGLISSFKWWWWWWLDELDSFEFWIQKLFTIESFKFCYFGFN